MTKEQLEEILEKVWMRDWSADDARDAIWGVSFEWHTQPADCETPEVAAESIARLRAYAKEFWGEPKTLVHEDVLAVCDRLEQAEAECAKLREALVALEAPKQWIDGYRELKKENAKLRAELAKIKSENSVTWHEAAILAAENRDAKLKERDQLRAALANANRCLVMQQNAAIDLSNQLATAQAQLMDQKVQN